MFIIYCALTSPILSYYFTNINTCSAINYGERECVCFFFLKLKQMALLLPTSASRLGAADWGQRWTSSVIDNIIKATSHAYCSLNGRVSVHDTTSVSGGERRLPEEEPGGPRAEYVVWTHGFKLSLGVYSTDGVFLPLGTLSPFYKRLQCTTGEPYLLWLMLCSLSDC